MGMIRNNSKGIRAASKGYVHATIVFSFSLATLLVVGCQHPAPSTSPRDVIVTQSPGPAVASGPRQDTVFGDPCADRLQNLGGALLEFFQIHKRLPDGLVDLPQPSAGPIACPDSNVQYGYVASGLAAPGESSRLILFDPAPTHAGLRNVVLMSHDNQGNPLIWPRRLSEKEFRAFTPKATMTPGAPR